MSDSIQNIQQTIKPVTAWLETAVITASLPALGYFLRPADPLFLEAGFAWLAFLPLLTGTRYGFFYGLCSGLVLAALTVFMFSTGYAGQTKLPLQKMLGFILVGMISGQFSDVWSRRLSQMQLFNDHIGIQFKRFARSYSQLKYSHDQLEERLAGQGESLRNALDELKLKVSQYSGDSRQLLAEQAGELLEFMSVRGQLHQACLYAVRRNKGLDKAPLASVGDSPKSFDASHPMIAACLQQKSLVTLKQAQRNMYERGEQQGLLAVVPIVDATGDIWALVTITAMPFAIFNHRTLNLMAVLAAAIGDFLYETYYIETNNVSRNSIEFLQTHLNIWSNYVQRFDVDASLVSVTIAPEFCQPDSQWRIDEMLLEQSRIPDIIISLPTQESGVCLLFLMPLTGLQGADGFRNRVTQMLENKIGFVPSTQKLHFNSLPVGLADSPDQLLTRMCQSSNAIISL